MGVFVLVYLFCFFYRTVGTTRLEEHVSRVMQHSYLVYNGDSLQCPAIRTIILNSLKYLANYKDVLGI